MMALASLAILVPLIGAVVLAALRDVLPRIVAEAGASLTAATVTGLCGVLAGRSGGPLEVLWLGAWRPVGGLPVGIALTPDAVGAGMAAFAGLLAVAALVTARTLREAADPLFDALVLVLLGAMVAFCLSGDLFTLFVFFELMSVCAYALVALRSEQGGPLQGSLNFAVVNSLGAISILIGVALLYGRTGALNLARIGEVLAQRAPDALVAVALALVAGGLLVKAAIVPFHFWLADAYAAAPAPVCLLLAGAFTELGLFGLARVLWTVFAAPLGSQLVDVRAVLVALGLATAVVGAVMALGQRHLRRLLAFVTVTTLGLFLIAVGLLDAVGLAGAAVWIVTDGFAKAALFVAIGAVETRFGTADAGELHGRVRDMPVTAAAFVVAALGTAGLPPLGPFWGKALTDHAAEALPGYGWLPWAMTVPALLAGAALLRAAGGIFAGIGRPPRRDPSSEQAHEEAGGGRRGHRSALLAGTAALLAIAGAAIVAVPGALDAAASAASAFADPAAYRSAVLAGASASPGPSSAPPPSTLAWVLGVASTLGAVALVALHARGASAHRAAAPLRAVHSGQVGDYVLWFATGLVALGGVWLALLT